jgi:hypothetical protein
MEVRSSRRMRTLVTRMAHRGLSANEIARALISMMARSMTRSKSKAGYIDARPHIRQLEEVLLQRTAGRPDHTCGSIAPFREHVGMSARDEHMFSGMPPIADVTEPCRHFRVSCQADLGSIGGPPAGDPEL